MSTHAVNIVEIPELKVHPNADKLAIVEINGWQVVVAKNQFKQGDRAIYVEPDYVVPTVHPEFTFLAKGDPSKRVHRMKAIRLRGQLSFGLLIPLPADFVNSPVGENVMEDLGIERWEPPIKFAPTGEDDALPSADWPPLHTPKFDLEDLRKYPDMFQPGERVFVTEKLHGGNAKVVWHNNLLFVGSRNRWLKFSSPGPFAQAIAHHETDAPKILELCKVYPDVIFFGEVYGPVQELRYGLKEPRFAVFAALEKGKWWDMTRLYTTLSLFDVHRAPLLFVGEYDREKIAALGEHDTEIRGAPAGHMMEGVVVVAEPVRIDNNIGRVALKLISNRYWES